MNDKKKDLRNKYLSYSHIKKLNTNNIPRVKFFASNFDEDRPLNSVTSDDDNRHYFNVGN